VSYVGRFAPSPTGDLHLGSLAAAVASYLHARQAGGEWLVRVEDIDPPREVAGSAASILRTLEAFGLHWDRAVEYQSRRHDAYRAIAAGLHARGAAYYCRCSRQEIRALTGGGRYPGTCRNLGLPSGDAALRLRAEGPPIAFTDYLQGSVERDVEATDGDFVIYRRDGLPAYHLAVVVDDAEQGVTDIVRGADLLDSTPLHMLLQRHLGLSEPRYWHIPLIVDSSGEKLSKASGAAAVDPERPGITAGRVLSLLGLDPPADLLGAPPDELWAWAKGRWKIETLAQRQGRVLAGDN
jgi:glutamyl-Q tRNA(Asp) synthetase